MDRFLLKHSDSQFTNLPYYLVVALPVLVLAEMAAVAGGVAAAARLGRLAAAVPAVGLK